MQANIDAIVHDERHKVGGVFEDTTRLKRSDAQIMIYYVCVESIKTTLRVEPHL